MFLNKEEFEEWMKRIMARLDQQDRKLEEMNKPHQTMLEGEVLFDNQDLCQLLHISGGTLQLKCISQYFRRLSSNLRRIGNDLETTEIHRSASFFIDSNNSFCKCSYIF